MKKNPAPFHHRFSRLSLPLTTLVLPFLLASCTELVVAPASPPQQRMPVASVVGSSGIVINEIMADPSAVTDDFGEWIEVHNTGTVSVNMTGWTLHSGNDGTHTVGTLSVAAGAHKVLARNSASKRNGGVSNAYQYGTGINLANASDWVVLRDGTGATVDSVAWTSMPAGATRGVTNPTIDHTNVNGTNWHTGTSVFGKGDRGTPGARNDGYAVVTAAVAVTVSPSSATITVGGAEQFTASAVDANGNPVTTTFTWSSSNSGVVMVNGSGMATAMAVGTAQIRATSANGVWGEAAVTVTAPGGGGGTPGDLVVRMLDVGQGDATYITDGVSKIFIDGGPSVTSMGAHLDALGLNNTTIDVVVISHAHADHYSGLRELFKTTRGITIRYLFENKDAGTAITLAELRDSINARVGRGQLIYRDTDDPCVTGAPTCTITMAGGSKLHLLRPDPNATTPNNRSGGVKLVGADSASFSMWFAGDAEHAAIDWFDTGANYDLVPGMDIKVLKADHHGSCNGVSRRYLELLSPEWVAIGVSATNSFGHVNTQTKALMTDMGIPWYRTDQNGTITFRSPGTPGGGYTATIERGGSNMSGSGDASSASSACVGM